ncbi:MULTISPECIES: hypothetical protein [unclassified Rhodococcus (in: high G+C Gram-positive bacteria)]|uniref:hypothetical protein n=1 Tax=unclassified Rhodococcus (in: high G+C Gram-positive bacteria) TaxID=192944 RepID=UPI00163AFBA9|nr:MULTISPECIES: hypothetical protein [unclassified Rhodococcus (in: high G+C Gram-positive bacteria)]MBC2639669.1 hypothetical protein [Rhodococcus sp. 3A]MBC2895586.1 hypothetical protein [Rhodococcus sp. 4CII]
MASTTTAESGMRLTKVSVGRSGPNGCVRGQPRPRREKFSDFLSNGFGGDLPVFVQEVRNSYARNGEQIARLCEFGRHPFNISTLVSLYLSRERVAFSFGVAELATVAGSFGVAANFAGRIVGVPGGGF